MVFWFLVRVVELVVLFIGMNKIGMGIDLRREKFRVLFWINI